MFTECEEVALAMVDALNAEELATIRQCQGTTPREYVKQQLAAGEPSEQTIDNVHEAFSRFIHLP